MGGQAFPQESNAARQSRFRNSGGRNLRVRTRVSMQETLKCEGQRMLGTILIILLILLLVGALPSWPYSSGWGYDPSGGLGLILVIVVVLVLLGRF